MTDVIVGVTDDTVWLQGMRMPWFITRLGPEKEKKHSSYICIIYLICNIYCLYLICILYIYIYIAYICKVESEWYINRTSFTTYIVEPTLPMLLRMTSSEYKVRGCPGSIPGWVLKKEKSIHLKYVLYILYVIYILCILYAYYISYILHIYLVKSEWYINRTSFTTYIVEPT